jgi:choline/glycine/proline betaine transport protein
MFFARISRGRTIREFVLGILLVPALLTLLWLVGFGYTALHMELFDEADLAGIVDSNMPVALFAMLDRLPFTWITSVFATLVILVFFVTSADSGSIVMAVLTSNGDPSPSLFKRVFWGLSTGASAAVLLAAGGLTPLQTAGLLTALPFSAVMLAICVSLWRGLHVTHTISRTEGETSANAERRRAG